MMIHRIKPLRGSNPKLPRRFGSIILPLIFICAVWAMAAGCKNKDNPENGTPESGAEENTPREFSIEAFGVVTAPRSITVTSEINGMIETLHVDRGDRLTLGEPVITLDIRNYTFDLHTLQTNLEAAVLRLEKLEQDTERADTGKEQEYKRLSNQITITRAELADLQAQREDKVKLLSDQRDPDIEKIKNDLAKARSDSENASEELAQNKDLYEAYAISEQELKTSESTWKDLENKISGLEFSLEKLLLSRDQELNSISLQIRQKETGLENLIIEREKLASPILTELAIQELEIEGIREQIRNHLKLLEKPWLEGSRVVCPYETGVVSEFFVQEGERIGQGTKVVQFFDASLVEVEGYVPEEFIRDIRVGDEAVITPVADTNRTYHGVVDSVATLAINRNNETVVPVTISVDNEDGFLIPNFNVDISFKSEAGDGSEPEEPPGGGRG